MPVEEIKSFISDFGEKAKDDRELYDWQWTRHIKNGLCEIGKKQRYFVYASQCDDSDGGEWLFDITWLNYIKNDLLSVELAGESEWDTAKVNDDFHKLLLCRANLRLFIFQAKTKEMCSKLLDDFIRQVNKFTGSMSGDRYLFSCWLMQEKKFTHRYYLHTA